MQATLLVTNLITEAVLFCRRRSFGMYFIWNELRCFMAWFTLTLPQMHGMKVYEYSGKMVCYKPFAKGSKGFKRELHWEKRFVENRIFYKRIVTSLCKQTTAASIASSTLPRCRKVRYRCVNWTTHADTKCDSDAQTVHKCQNGQMVATRGHQIVCGRGRLKTSVFDYRRLKVLFGVNMISVLTLNQKSSLEGVVWLWQSLKLRLQS